MSPLETGMALLAVVVAGTNVAGESPRNAPMFRKNDGSEALPVRCTNPFVGAVQEYQTV